MLRCLRCGAEQQIKGKDLQHLPGAIMDGYVCYPTSVLHQSPSTCRVISSSAIVMVLVIDCVLLSEVTSSVLLIR